MLGPLRVIFTVTLEGREVGRWEYTGKCTTRRGYEQAMRRAWARARSKWWDEYEGRGTLSAQHHPEEAV